MAHEAARKFRDQAVESWLDQGCLLGLTSALFYVGWGVPKRQSRPDESLPSLYAPDFYLEDEDPWWIFPNYVVLPKEELLHLLRALPKAKGAKHPSEWQWAEPRQRDFATQFNAIKKEFETGAVEKMVPAVFETATMPGWKAALPLLLRKNLVRAGKRIPYGLWTADEGILGASPEILFHYRADENTLESMALAGTRARMKEKQHSLVNDPKEMFEHDLVVRDLKGRLKKMGDMKISPTYVWELGKLCHLRTDLEIELNVKPKNPQFFLETCQMLHPTPALGVSPRSFPFTWLKNSDGKVKRRRFGAPFGVLRPDGSARVLVAIRNVQWQKDTFFLGAGCGVVPQSDLMNEWKELRIKRKSIKELLGFE